MTIIGQHRGDFCGNEIVMHFDCGYTKIHERENDRKHTHFMPVPVSWFSQCLILYNNQVKCYQWEKTSGE